MSARIMIVAGAALLLLSALLPACRRSRVVTTAPAPAPAVAAAAPIAPGEFATEEGVWEYESDEGTTKLTVSLQDRGNSWALNWALEFSVQGCGNLVPLLNPKDSWFVYLEGPRSVWIHDGQETVHRVVLNADGSSSHATARGTGEFRFEPKTQAPQAVLDRLPKNMQGLFQVAPPLPPPPPAPKKVRPSI